jgi:hypothetical protein
MRVPKEQLAALAQSKERRRFRRVRVDLAGRYMLADGHEYPCQVVDMSPDGMALTAPMAGKIGERVIIYLEHIGRLEGAVARVYSTGFGVKFTASSRKRDKLAAQLTWLTSRPTLGLAEDRQHPRVIPTNPDTQFVLPDGTSVKCRLLDVSPSGAAIASDSKPPVGTLIRLGKTECRVVRMSKDSFGVQFTRSQDPDFLRQHVTEHRSPASSSK